MFFVVLAQLHFRRGGTSCTARPASGFSCGSKFPYRDAVEVPPVRVGYGFQSRFLRVSDSVMYRTDSPRWRAIDQELHRDRRLARAGRAFDQIQPAGGQASGQNVIETDNAGLRDSVRIKLGLHFSLPWHLTLPSTHPAVTPSPGISRP